MPLKLIECVLPWLVGSVSDQEARSLLHNMYLAGSISVLKFYVLNFIDRLLTNCVASLLSVPNSSSYQMQLLHQILH